MALGGGTWVTQNKIEPGTYQNFVSAQRSFVNLANRGTTAVVMALKWGKDDEVFTVTNEEFQTNSLGIFGYGIDAPELKGLNDVFLEANTVHIRKLSLTDAEAAANDFGTARYKGTRGNALAIQVVVNVDDQNKWDVITFLDGREIDKQTALTNATELVDNEFVIYKKTATLAVAAATPLTGGADGTGADTGTPHQEALDDLESYNFNTLACLSSVATIKNLYVAYTKRVRDEVGAKFQLVVHKATNPDFEGVINVENDAIGDGEEVFGAVYWTVGAEAAAPINLSLVNKTYRGSYTLSLADTNTQAKIRELIKAGKFAFHRVGDDINVIKDINSFTSFTPDKNEDFSENQLIRIIDQIAIDTANIFNGRYLGKVPNDADGRISLWNDLTSQRLELQRLRAIQDYDVNGMTVEQGQSKRAVVVRESITWTATMEQLYTTTVVA